MDSHKHYTWVEREDRKSGRVPPGRWEHAPGAIRSYRAGRAPGTAVAVALEMGDLARFPSAEPLASYAGTTPRGHASGGRVRYGKLRPDGNRYRQGALVEAANSVAVNSPRSSQRPGSRRSARRRERQGHPKALAAVARHLAAAAFPVLHGQPPYRDPAAEAGSATQGSARCGQEPPARGRKGKRHIDVVSPLRDHFQAPPRAKR